MTATHIRSDNDDCISLRHCVCLHNDTATATHSRSHDDECLSLRHCVCLPNGTVTESVRVEKKRQILEKPPIQRPRRSALPSSPRVSVRKKSWSLNRWVFENLTFLFDNGTVTDTVRVTHCAVVTTMEVLWHCATACIHTKTSDSHIHTVPHTVKHKSRALCRSHSAVGCLCL